MSYEIDLVLISLFEALETALKTHDAPEYIGIPLIEEEPKTRDLGTQIDEPIQVVKKISKKTQITPKPLTPKMVSKSTQTSFVDKGIRKFC